MITLKEIVASNIEMLNEQEASLMKSLDFVRKARLLFESQEDSGRRGRKRQNRKPGRKRIARAKLLKRIGATSTTRRKRSGGSHMDKIMAVLKENQKPMSSGELLNTLFSRQTADRDRKHFGTLIYPVLTKAYKTGALKSKNGKIHIGS